ncbi:MAG: hypothetical protein N3E44_08020, partial [Candidatus Bathyarchaeota archaeon]|nr:hypothetical protein [Candidatus Bathyarchaeota archaeon]
LLLGGIFEALKEGGWSPETRSLLWDSFIKDSRIIEELNLEDMLLRIGEKISKKWGLCLS